MIASILVNAADASTDILGSAPVLVGDEKYYSFQAVFGGVSADLVGTFKLQSSVNGSTWVDISGKSTSVTGSTSTLLTGVNVGEPYVRFYWDYTSGTGTITVYLVIKQNQVYE